MLSLQVLEDAEHLRLARGDQVDTKTPCGVEQTGLAASCGDEKLAEVTAVCEGDPSPHPPLEQAQVEDLEDQTRSTGVGVFLIF